MSAGFMSTMLKHWLVTSRCHRLIRRSSADTNVSPSLRSIDKHFAIALPRKIESGSRRGMLASLPVIRDGVDVELVSAIEDSPALCRVPIAHITYLFNLVG